MFEVAENLDGILAGVLLLIWWWAAVRVGRLPWQPADRRPRRARRARVLVTIGLGLMVVKIVAVGLLWSVAWVFADNRVIVQMPLLLVGSAAVIVLSYPRLNRIAAGPVDTSAVDGDDPGVAADPRLAVPVSAMAAASAVAVYFAYVSRPVPPYLDDVLTHDLTILIATVLLIWWQIRVQARFTGHTRVPVSRGARRLAGVATRTGLVVLLLILGVGYLVQNSRLPDKLSMADHTVVDYGGGQEDAHSGPHTGHLGIGQPGAVPNISVNQLRGPTNGTPDKSFTLTAQETTVRLSSGRQVTAWTYNGQSPGPELRVDQGDLVEVKLINNLPHEGVTLHWHGLDIPNGEDGVAGATQDAVQPGQSFVYRFRAEQVGTFWYHTHQDPLVGVRRGLFGAIIVSPRGGIPEKQDIVVMPHEWRINGKQYPSFGTSDTLTRQVVPAGTTVRLRLINTDNNPAADDHARELVLDGTPFKVVAIDGTDLSGPTELKGIRLPLSAGGRNDLTFTMPANPVRLTDLGNPKGGLVLAPDATAPSPPDPPSGLPLFNPGTYGSAAPTDFGPGSTFNRKFTLLLDDRLGFFDGTLHFLPIINGHSFPDIPTLMVREGDLVEMRLVNRSHQNHPMHLHGHHALVLSYNGVRTTGSPWWVDSLDIHPGDQYEIAFRADNPGLWMDHCHNLDHAANGMLMHLMYEGITTPYLVGRGTVNHPE